MLPQMIFVAQRLVVLVYRPEHRQSEDTFKQKIAIMLFSFILCAQCLLTVVLPTHASGHFCDLAAGRRSRTHFLLASEL